MKKTGNTAKYAGILFLVAMVASLIGGGLLESYRENSNHLLLVGGVLFESVNALAVLGIGILLFPVLKKLQSSAALTYLGFRVLEALACLAAPLVLVLIDDSGYLRAFFTGSLIPHFFCCGAAILYTFLFVYQIVPRFISIWGFIGVLGIIILNVAKVGTGTGMLLALPIILNEIFLGIWLIVKRFDNTKNYYATTV